MLAGAGIDPAAAQKGPVTLDQLAGGWLSKEYMAALKDTRDPMEAIARVPDACGLSIFKPDDDAFRGHYTRGLVYNFHEGGDSPVLLEMKPAGGDSFVLVFGAAVPGRDPKDPVKLVPSVSDERVRIVSRTGPAVREIEWSRKVFGDNQKMEWRKSTFVKIDKPSGRIVNELVLAGKYKDQRGRSFVFTDEKAGWPGRAFNYAVQRDFAEGWPTRDCRTFDVLDDKNGRITGKNGFPERMGYRREGKTLYIYNLDYPEDTGEIVCGKDPVHVLTEDR
jgi:hypothetical protein